MTIYSMVSKDLAIFSLLMKKECNEVITKASVIIYGKKLSRVLQFCWACFASRLTLIPSWTWWEQWTRQSIWPNSQWSASQLSNLFCKHSSGYAPQAMLIGIQVLYLTNSSKSSFIYIMDTLLPHSWPHTLRSSCFINWRCSTS